eukprot:3119414-Pyramimonas_sp.AAC.1
MSAALQAGVSRCCRDSAVAKHRRVTSRVVPSNRGAFHGGASLAGVRRAILCTPTPRISRSTRTVPRAEKEENVAISLAKTAVDTATNLVPVRPREYSSKMRVFFHVQPTIRCPRLSET